MTDRQQALAAYMMTIKPFLVGARTPEEILARIMKCVAEDAGFVGESLLQAFASYGRRLAEESGRQLADSVGRSFQSFLLGFSKKR